MSKRHLSNVLLAVSIAAACEPTVANHRTVEGGEHPPSVPVVTSAPLVPQARPTLPPAPPVEEPADGRDGHRIFISGHSLNADPLGEDIVAIARSLGVEAEFNQQIVIGSPIRVRVRGMNPRATGYEGYRLGQNRRGGHDMDVLAEIRAPNTVGGSYDTLLITERHDILNVLLWEDTVRYLRHFHDRIVERRPNAKTYLYHAWLGIRDPDAPQAWIAYERSAVKMWECIAERVNVSLEAENQTSRVEPLPSGVALTELVERALAGRIPGLSGGSSGDVLRRIFADQVHPTRVGMHYLALVSFATIFERSPVGAAVPQDLDASLVLLLQSLAWEVVDGYRSNRRLHGLSACRAYVRDSFCSAFLDYLPPRHPGERQSTLARCRDQFGEHSSGGAFSFDPGRDAAYWLRAP